MKKARDRFAVAAALVVAAMNPAPAAAQTPKIFDDADYALGAKLLAEHKCNVCHARNVGGDGTDIYKSPGSKVTTPGLLRGMVDYCSTELGLGLFPEEVTAIAAVLNRDFYKFVEKK